MIDEKYSVVFEYIGKEVTPVGTPKGMGGMLAGLLAGALFRGRGRAMKSTPKAMPKAQAAPKAAQPVMKPDENIDYAAAKQAAARVKPKRSVSSPGMRRTMLAPKVKPMTAEEQFKKQFSKESLDKARKEMIERNNKLNLAPLQPPAVVKEPELVAASQTKLQKIESNDKEFVREMKKMTENVKNQEKVGDK